MREGRQERGREREAGERESRVTMMRKANETHRPFQLSTPRSPSHSDTWTEEISEKAYYDFLHDLVQRMITVDDDGRLIFREDDDIVT